MVSNNFLSGPVVMILGSCVTLVLVGSGYLSLRRKQYYFYLINSTLGVTLIAILVVAIIFSFILHDNIEHDINKVNVKEQLSKESH